MKTRSYAYRLAALGVLTEAVTDSTLTHVEAHI